MADCGCGRSPTGQCIGWHNLTEEEYQAAVYDLVNFLTYIAEPMAEQRKHIGRLVLLFLLLLLVPTVLLNREYWKGIH